MLTFASHCSSCATPLALGFGRGWGRREGRFATREASGGRWPLLPLRGRGGARWTRSRGEGRGRREGSRWGWSWPWRPARRSCPRGRGPGRCSNPAGPGAAGGNKVKHKQKHVLYDGDIFYISYSVFSYFVFSIYVSAAGCDAISFSVKFSTSVAISIHILRKFFEYIYLRKLRRVFLERSIYIFV